MNSYDILACPAKALPEGYRNMIYSKWLRSLRYGNDYFKLINAESYFPSYQRYIDLLLSRPETRIRLAVLTDDNDIALGFSVYRASGDFNILDYVHVHKDHRKNGIGAALLPPNIQVITHLTKIGLAIWGSKMRGVDFNPFA